MNCEKGCVSFGGDDTCDALGELEEWTTATGGSIWLGGVAVPSLKSSVAVDALWVRGDGNCP